MKIRYYILGVILSVALGLAGCNKDNGDDPTEGTGELHLSAQIEGMAADEGVTRFRNGQGVGIWLSASPKDADLNLAEVARNVQFLQGADGLVSDPLISWDGQPSLELYAYAPYDAKAGENPVAYAFSINSRQDSLALLPEGNEKNDLLYAKQRVKYSDESTMLSFRHLMSKVVLHLHGNFSTPGMLTGSEVKVNNVLLNASVDLGTGTVTAKGNAGDVVSAELKELPAGIEIVREAIIVPQKVTVGTQFLEILTADNNIHVWNTESELNFESGKQIILDVLVKEKECVVRIKEIAPWRDNEVITGNAVGEKTYQVFDFYDQDGVQGIVINVDESGKHGWIVSLDETELTWATEDPHVSGIMPSANNNDDAVANLNACLLYDKTLERFPAMKWCNDKNVDGVTGWVLPAHNVLKLFGDLVIKDAKWDDFNAAIKQAPVENKKEMKRTGCYYLSSTVSATTDNVKTIMYSDWAESMGFSTYYQTNNTVEQNVLWRVRAFHEF